MTLAAQLDDDLKRDGFGPLMGVADVTRALNCSSSTVYRRVSEKRLTPLQMRDGGPLYFRRAEVAGLLVPGG